MAQARVQSVSVQTGNATTITVSLPTGTAAGDLLIAWHTSPTQGLQLTSGFTNISNMTGLEANFARASWKIATSGDVGTGSIDFSANGSANQLCRLIRITGHRTSSPVGSPNESQSSGATVTPASITYGSVDDTVIALGSSNNADTWTGSAADGGATITEKADSTFTGCSSAAYEVTRATAGETGVVTLTRSTTDSDANGTAFLITADSASGGVFMGHNF